MRLILIAVALVIGAVLLIGALLPRGHTASRSIVVAAPPAQVYDTIVDFAGAPAWRKEIARIELLGRVDGRLRFKEHGRHGAVTYEVTAEERPRRLVTEIVDRDLGYSGSWTYDVAPEASGTRLTITERGDVSNILFRFMSRFVFGQTRTIDVYLAALAAHLRTMSAH